MSRKVSRSSKGREVSGGVGEGQGQEQGRMKKKQCDVIPVTAGDRDDASTTAARRLVARRRWSTRRPRRRAAAVRHQGRGAEGAWASAGVGEPSGCLNKPRESRHF